MSHDHDPIALLKALNAVRTVRELLQLTEHPDRPDIGERLAERILVYRDEVGGFEALTQLRRVKGIGARRFQSIVEALGRTLHEFYPFSEAPAVLRSRLAIALRPFLTISDADLQIRGAENVGGALERLSGKLGAEFSQYLGSVYEAALELNAVSGATRVADVVAFPQLAEGVTVGAPRGVLDPATLPGIGADGYWIRATIPLFIEPLDVGQVELLTPNGWQAALEFEERIAVTCAGSRVFIRRVREGLLGPLGLGPKILDPARAVRITCGGGMRGSLPRPPAFLDGRLSETPPPLPVGWGYPKRDIWINPLPGWPGRLLTGGSGPYLPGAVVVGGSTDGDGNETDDGDTVVVGTFPRVAIGVRHPLPWPWGPRPDGRWPWPWPPKETDRPDPDWRNGVYISTNKPVDKLTVTINGCACIRKPETSKYVAEPSEEGGAYKWTIIDDEIAVIEGPDDQKEVTVRSKKIGKTPLAVDYTLDNRTAGSRIGLSVIYHKFTPRDTPGGEILAVPVFHPAPHVRIAHLQPTFMVDEVQPANHRATFLLNLTGQLGDALVDIEEIEVSAGRDFRRQLSRGGNEYGKFDDDRFEARKIAVWGPGRSYVRVRAKNSIGYYGTDTLDVVIKLNPVIEDIITSREDDLRQLRKQKSPADTIKAAEEALSRAWRAALETPHVEFGYLNHSDSNVRRIPGNEKWSIAVEDDAKVGTADVNTVADEQTIVIIEKRKELLAPKVQPKNYFVVHEAYKHNRITYVDHGRLLGKAGEAASIIYVDDCCAHGVAQVGVEFVDLPAVRRIKKTDGVELVARGLPEAYLGFPGTYRWSVAAHPVGANFRFEPANPSVGRVTFHTDTPGVYSFKVDYSLLDAASPWTYAIADCQILFKIETVVKLHRLGNYAGDYAVHRERPLYRERTVAEQPGAELLVINREGGPLGQDLEVQVYSPEELVLGESLTARAYFTDGTQHDYPLRIDGNFKFHAQTEIRAARIIEHLHIIGIRYGNLSQNRGDAVWLDVRVRPLALAILDLEGDGLVTTPATASNISATIGNTPMVAVAADGSLDTTSGGDAADNAQPIVNLLLRTRDLGDADASRAMIGLNEAGVHVNLTNGNQFLQLPLFESFGMGLSLSPVLCYNSKAATLAEAIKFYARVNQRTEEDLTKEFGAAWLGPGWSVSTDMALRQYVDADGGIENPILQNCAEITFPDGNRISFLQTSQANTYHVRSDAETLGDEPDVALGMVLTKLSDDRWQLEDMAGMQWIFDEDGRLEEQTDLRMRVPNRSLNGLRWTWFDTGYEITDSSDRVTTFKFNSDGRLAEIEAPDETKYYIHYTDDRVSVVELPEGISWGFDYGEQSLLTVVKPPIGHAETFTHYLDAGVETVPEQIARAFWGRVARLQFGQRRYSIRYEERSDSTQIVTCLDPEEHEWRFTYDATRQACDSVDYRDARSAAPWRRQNRWQYRAASKAVWVATNLHGHETSFNYVPSGVGKAQLLQSMNRPNLILQEWRHGPRGLVREYVDEMQATTSFTHEVDGQTKTITHPQIPVIEFDLSRTTAQPTEEFTYDHNGRLRTHLEADGVLTTYEYDGSGDPHGTGLPTGIMDGAFRQEFSYDVMGRILSSKSVFGLVTDREYDDRCRLKQITAGAFRVVNTYDALDRLLTETDSLGRTSTHVYDDYGELKSVTNAEGRTRTYLDRDLNGNLLALEQEDGSVVEYSGYDALGRWHAQRLPDVARRGNDGLSTPNMPEVSRDFTDTPTQFPLIGVATTRVTERAGNSVTTWHYNPHGRVVAEEVSVNGYSTVTLREHDQRGNVVSETVVEGAERRTLFVNEWDASYELVATTVSGMTTRYCTSRDAEGLYTVELLPRQARQTGRDPAIIRRFDDNDRLLAEYNGEGKITVKYEYSTNHRTCTVRSADPAEMADSDVLIETQIVQYNDRGQAEMQTDPRTGQSTRYGFDAAGRLETVSTTEGTTRFRYTAMDLVKEVETTVPAAQGTVAVGSGPAAALPQTTTAPCIVRNEYDAMGRLTRQGTDAVSENWSYDALGRAITIRRSGLGGGRTAIEEIFYDAFGEERARWFAPGEYLRYRRDRARRLVTEIWHHGGIADRELNYQHDILGNVSRTWTNTHPFEFEQRHDALGRRISHAVKKNGTAVASCSVDYGRHSLPDSVTVEYGGSSRTSMFTYDSDLRTIAVEDSSVHAGRTYTFNYNRAGARTAIVRPAGAQARTEYVYLSRGGIHRVRHKFGQTWNAELLTTFDAGSIDRFGNPQLVRHVYSEDGNLKRVPQVPETEQHVFDSANRLIGSTVTGSAAGLYTRVFGDLNPYLKFLLPITAQAVLDLAALLTPDTSAEVRTNYYFDAQSRRVLEVSRMTPDVTEPNKQQFLLHHFRYGSGQAVEEEIQEWYDIGQSTPRYIRTRYEYDRHGRRIAEIQTLRQAGGGAWARLKRLDYDFGNKPHTIREFEKRGSRLHTLSITSSVYDTEDRLVHVKLETFDDSELGESGSEAQLAGQFAALSDFQGITLASVTLQRADKRSYVYAGNDLVAVLDGAGNVIEEYLNGPGSNARLAVRRDRMLRGWTSAEYYNDHRDTSVVLTADNGEVLEHYPQPGTYGEAMQRVPEAVHAGMWSGLGSVFEAGARKYDPSTRQFYAPDPLGIMGGLSIYSFAADNPVSFRDSSGGYVETVWDLASLGVGITSFCHNVNEGNFGWAVVDAIGIGVDAVAALLPIVPGGAGMAIKGYRVAGAAAEVAKTARKFDKVVPDGAVPAGQQLVRVATAPRTHVITGGGTRVLTAVNRLREINTALRYKPPAPTVVAGGVRNLDRLKALKSALAPGHNLSWGTITEKVGVAGKDKSVRQEIIGVGAAIDRIEGLGWRLEGAVKYGPNHGIDLVFRGVLQNAGRFALAEAKHSASLGALTTPSRIRQGSLLYFFTRAARGQRYDLTRAIAAGNVTFYGYFHRRKVSLVEFHPLHFLSKAALRKGSKAFSEK